MKKSVYWPLADLHWNSKGIKQVVCDVIDSGQLTMGEHVQRFEAAFAEKVGAKHAVMVNSGSSANLLAVAAMHWSSILDENQPYRLMMGAEHEQREAIVPAIAWPTTYAPLAQYGYKLRVIDVDPQTLAIDLEKAHSAINEYTEIIVGASILGHPANLEGLKALAAHYGLWFLEDNCESLGAGIAGRQCGTFGHVGTFSTFLSHHLQTVEGGVLVTNHSSLADLARCMRAHGWTRDLLPDSILRSPPTVTQENPPLHSSTPSTLGVGSQGPGTDGCTPLKTGLKEGLEGGDYCFVLPGYNLRPTELQAAIGLVQLQTLDQDQVKRRANWLFFDSLFQDLPGFTYQKPGYGCSIPFGFVLIADSPELRSRATASLQKSGIEYRMVTGGCFTEHPVAKRYNYVAQDDLPNAKRVHHCGFFVGNHPRDLRKEIMTLRQLLEEVVNT